MLFHNINQNIIIFFSIFLMIGACQKENKKIVVQNTHIIDTKKKNNKTLNVKKFSKDKIIKKEITSNNENVSINLKNDNVIFEFRNER